MAFGGYTVTRSNVFNPSVRDTSETWDLSDAMGTVKSYVDENVSGDVITLFEEETEDSGYMISSWFNHPNDGWKN